MFFRTPRPYSTAFENSNLPSQHPCARIATGLILQVACKFVSSYEEAGTWAPARGPQMTKSKTKFIRNFFFFSKLLYMV